MPDELIEKLISDLEDIPREHTFHLSPFKVNEPFLDKRIFKILESINKRIPNASIRLFTNGTTLTSNNLKKIAQVQNVENLWISLNDHRPDKYREVMQLSIDTVIKNMDRLHDMDFQHNVIVQKVADMTDADFEFKEWVNTRYPKFKVWLLKREAWIDFQTSSDQVPDTKCSRWHEIEVTTSGLVPLCCMDGHAKYIIGDASKQHLLEIFNAPHFKQMRIGDKSRRFYDPCYKCTY